MRTPRTSAHARLGALGVCAALALAALGSARADEGDPPSRVARLSYVEGAVSLQPAGLPDWTAAERNRPLTTGDRLWTDQESVAELDLGDGVLRLGAMTGFAFLNLDDRVAQIQLSAGALVVRVWDTSSGQSYEIDTPQLAVQLTQPGAYRVEVDEPGSTTLVKVSEGEAIALGPDGPMPIDAQRVMVFTGSASGTSLSYSAATLGPPDDLDTWSATRDRQEQESPSRQYVADDTPGTYELDDNGRWQSTPEYGDVWTPAVVVAGWVPYRFGHWVWIAPWGWTWVDEAPWGYATFHYGRWVFLNGSWCWVPGPQPLRPVYAPALVAWTHGPGFAGPGGAPNVGWFPLGPHEVYAPAGRVSDAYLRNVNTANTTLTSAGYITDVYQNRVTNIHYVNNSAAAISAVPQKVFTSAQRITGHTLPMTAGTLAGMSVAAAAPAVTPQRQSVLGAGVGPKVMRPPPSLANRAVIAHASPPRAPASFETQLAAIQANGGRPLAAPELARLQPGIPTARVRVVATPKAPRSPQAQSMQAPAQPSLGERARTLENSSLPPATTTRTFVPAGSAEAPAPAGPTTPAHTDRPPGALRGTFSSYEAPHVEEKPSASAEPDHRPEKPATRVQTSAAPAATLHSTRAASSPPPPSHPQQHPAPKTKSAEHPRSESRDESPKADRSRDRVER